MRRACGACQGIADLIAEFGVRQKKGSFEVVAADVATRCSSLVGRRRLIAGWMAAGGTRRRGERIGVSACRSGPGTFERGLIDIAQMVDAGEDVLANPASYRSAAQLELIGDHLEAGLAQGAGSR